MFKFVVLATIVCVANAGLIGLGGGLEGGHGVAVAVSHGATSYQNNNQISLHPVPVVATHAVAAAPVAVAHAPLAIGIGHGGLGLGLH